MTLKTLITDGEGKGTDAHVNKAGALVVSNVGLPPDSRYGSVRIFRQYFTADGTSTGSNDMRVAGTLAAPIEFYIPSSSDGDRYIDSISFVIADGGATLNNFGNITPLTNGVEIFYEDTILGNVIIHEGAKSNFDFVQLAQGNPSFGSGSTSFRANNVIGASEGFLPTLDFSTVFGLPWGIRIPKGSTLRLVIRIRDNTTAIDRFDAIAYGYDRIIEE